MVMIAGVESRVLVVDDDPEMLEALDLVFSASGHGCELVPKGLGMAKSTGHRRSIRGLMT